MLNAAGVEWKDTRFPGKEWPERKGKTPLGAVPILKIDGVEYVQSLALARYAAKLAGFYPEDPLEGLKVDEAMDTLNELMSKAPHGGSTVEEKKAARQEYQKTTMTQFFGFLEKRIQDSGGKSIASTPSIADIVLQSFVQTIKDGFWDHIDKDFFDSYPGCTAVSESILEHEKIKQYYAK